MRNQVHNGCYVHRIKAFKMCAHKKNRINSTKSSMNFSSMETGNRTPEEVGECGQARRLNGTAEWKRNTQACTKSQLLTMPLTASFHSYKNSCGYFHNRESSHSFCSERSSPNRLAHMLIRPYGIVFLSDFDFIFELCFIFSGVCALAVADCQLHRTSPHQMKARS